MSDLRRLGFSSSWSSWALALSVFLGGCRTSLMNTADAGPTADGGPKAAPTAGDAAVAVAPPAPPPADVPNILPAPSDDTEGRMRHLLEAIVQDSPELAQDVLLPRRAFFEIADSKDPGKSWDDRIKAPFDKSIHKLHRAKGMEQAVYATFELGRTPIHVTPRKNEFKSAVWRVKRSQVFYRSDGHTHSVIVAEMISWRGAWYVTKLR